MCPSPQMILALCRDPTDRAALYRCLLIHRRAATTASIPPRPSLSTSSPTAFASAAAVEPDHAGQVPAGLRRDANRSRPRRPPRNIGQHGVHQRAAVAERDDRRRHRFTVGSDGPSRTRPVTTPGRGPPLSRAGRRSAPRPRTGFVEPGRHDHRGVHQLCSSGPSRCGTGHATVLCANPRRTPLRPRTTAVAQPT